MSITKKSSKSSSRQTVHRSKCFLYARNFSFKFFPHEFPKFTVKFYCGEFISHNMDACRINIFSDLLFSISYIPFCLDRPASYEIKVSSLLTISVLKKELAF